MSVWVYGCVFVHVSVHATNPHWIISCHIVDPFMCWKYSTKQRKLLIASFPTDEFLSVWNTPSFHGSNFLSKQQQQQQTVWVHNVNKSNDWWYFSWNEPSRIQTPGASPVAYCCIVEMKPSMVYSVLKRNSPVSWRHQSEIDAKTSTND
jgi:hypothetical protein